MIKTTLLASILAAATLVGCAGSHKPTQPIAAAPVAPAPTPTIDIDTARSSLAARRALNLARLHAYATAGVFPLNRHSDGPLNVFIDEDGHICAAANLIDLDGHGDLVRATAAADNFLVLRDVKSGPLMEWMLTSGFTQEEIALIQEPYMPVEYEDPQVQPEPAPTAAFAEPPPPVISQSWADQERARLQQVLLGVHAVLSANTNKSLTIAMDRLAAQPRLMAAVAPTATPDEA